ncbi:adenosylcobinamide-GDP ribazoletransferase [Pseudobutyrivibrio xylanivorans]|uniref:Adenosylcobinamide-GDP ribazoletransferase n=1 Tax=Pseudobutyrivibrio xylanivorans DSM 14809 TaxID=1123012 RepID=A0A1M6CEC5_PSEXY|nr:adenosylcobinamide-GDP ribazoletransferase [Pseudobutyrivibrio xylanivorans]SHI59352.1 cobalamin-5'-phosphate synthase [Pseudobutyrivibrio xylanivorans DSM 14809]
MKLLKSIVVAFSMYSRIPMPRFNWDSEDMEYHLIFFPFIGAIIGFLVYWWRQFTVMFYIGDIVFSAIAIVIPIVITGGFHIDGYMDTSDALASWGDKEKRHEILKDSHIGAFAVIRLVALGLILFSALFLMDDNAVMAWCFSFVAARCVSGICVVSSKKAKNDGILSTSAKNAKDKVVIIFLAIEFILCALTAGYLLQWYWTVSLAALVIALIRYIYVAYSKFGGITGDLAGWFVCSAETLMAVAVAVLSVMGNALIF